MLTFSVRIESGNFAQEDKEEDIDWHVGETPPKERFEEADLQVLSVYADGHELEYIGTFFTGIPYRLVSRSNLWRGEIARFIWDNLDKSLPPSLKR